MCVYEPILIYRCDSLSLTQAVEHLHKITINVSSRHHMANQELYGPSHTSPPSRDNKPEPISILTNWDTQRTSPEQGTTEDLMWKCKFRFRKRIWTAMSWTEYASWRIIRRSCRNQWWYEDVYKSPRLGRQRCSVWVNKHVTYIYKYLSVQGAVLSYQADKRWSQTMDVRLYTKLVSRGWRLHIISFRVVRRFH